MPNFQRYYVPNSLVFITAVTHKRFPYLQTSENVELLFETLRCVQQIHPFHLLAYVILPNHFHWLMSLEDDIGNFSTVLHSAKRNYSLNYKKIHSIKTPVQLWQERFWDHVIRDEEDLSNHFDYFHFNPVKHGYVKKPEDWLYSTYLFWYERKYYPTGWGCDKAPDSIEGMNFE